MDKIKRWYRSVPLWLTLFLFMILALLLSFSLSGKVNSAVSEKLFSLQMKYVTRDETGNGAGDKTGGEESSGVHYSGEVEGSVVYDFHLDKYSAADARQLKTYRAILKYAPPLIYAASILAAVLLFYFSKLKKPLGLLRRASAQIAAQKLDFSLNYAGSDEMAKLCAVYDDMRRALFENRQKMLRMIQERKQVNDAYTHDLRTPLAVLRGYADLLVKYLPEEKLSADEVLSTVKTMSVHIDRLEQFAGSMNAIQKLEDQVLCRQRVPADEFLGQLRETAQFLCQEKALGCSFDTSVSQNFLNLDPTAVVQVYENLLNNALRFAARRLAVYCADTPEKFLITVSDDGKGFADSELRQATSPYYSGNGSHKGTNFGLGLFICRTLCEKHGGALALMNNESGGAKAVASFALKP